METNLYSLSVQRTENVKRMMLKKEQKEQILELIAKSHAIGKPLIRRTRKSQEYLKFVKVKEAREEMYQQTCTIFKQRQRKSKSIAGSNPLKEGHVTKIDDDNTTKMGIETEREKRTMAKRFTFDKGLKKFGQRMLEKLKSMYVTMYEGKSPVMFNQKKFNADNKEVLVLEEVDFKSEKTPRYFRKKNYICLKPRL